MKKFLTLTLALVMAFALAAPAMAFVDYEYEVASAYDLDFYLVDYDESYDLFSSTGVWTELPAADRGYVKNELVGAVVEVLVPAYNTGNDAYLAVTGENVKLNYNVTGSSQSVYGPVANRNVAKLAGGLTYGWSYNSTDEELLLDGNGSYLFENNTSKDVEAAWLVFGKVMDDEATLTATLYHGRKFNSNLAIPTVGTTTTARYKIGGNEWVVELVKVVNDGYVYKLYQEEGSFKDANGDEIAMFLYTDKNFKTKMMVATVGTDPTTTTATTSNIYGLLLNDWGTGKQLDLSQGGLSYAYSSTVSSPRALAAQINSQKASLTSGGDFNVTADDKTVLFTAAVGSETSTLSFTATLTDTVDASKTRAVALQQLATSTGAVTSSWTDAFYKVDTNKDLMILNDGFTMASATDGEPAGTLIGGVVKDYAVSRFVDEVCADFGLDPAKVGNVLKPAYLGTLKMGIIEEITLDIQPWQAYVTIPDIEVIDPPKTGDAATLAGFVMIVLAAAGVVVFKKVRA